MFEGLYVAIVTPFKDGKIDEDAYKKLIDTHAEAGTDGIVPCGTTGESPTLTPEEQEHLIGLTVKFADKRMKVMAGTGSNSTAEAVEYTKAAEKAGADAALVVNPYYNKPTQKGLYKHFKQAAESVKIPIIIYNIKSRTAVNVEVPTMVELSKIENIKGVKEASGDLSQMTEVVRQCGPEFDVLSGDDALTLPLLSVGGKGVVSVAGNFIPKDIKEMINAYKSGDVKKATELNQKIFSVVKGMFLETNPIPVKAAMEILGMTGGEIRMPLTAMEGDNLDKLRKILTDYGLDVKK